MTRLQLTGAHITGRLSLHHAKIEVPISLIDCCFDEPIELNNAVLGAADFTGCHLPEFQADGLRVNADLTLARLVTGRLSLSTADIGGNLWLNAAQVSGAGPGFAVHGAQLRVGGGLYAESIRVTGGLNLWGAQAFSIEFTNARLACAAGPALRGDGLAVGHDLQCSSLMISDGGITLFGASIGGQFWLNNTEVRNTTGWAMNAPMITVGGGIYARGLTAHGGVNLFGVVVGESVELPASTLSSPRGRSLRAPGARVGGASSWTSGICQDR